MQAVIVKKGKGQPALQREDFFLKKIDVLTRTYKIE